MLAKKIGVSTYIVHTIKAMDARNMVNPHYETTSNLYFCNMLEFPFSKSFEGQMCFTVWEEGFQDGSEMVTKGISITLTNIDIQFIIYLCLRHLWLNLLHFHPIQP